MVAVNEINIRVSWRAKQNGVARGLSGRGMRGGIVGSQIGFDFNNSRDQTLSPLPPDQKFPQQIRPDDARIAIVKSVGKNAEPGTRHTQIIAQVKR